MRLGCRLRGWLRGLARCLELRRRRPGVRACRAAVHRANSKPWPAGRSTAGLIPGYCRPCVTSAGSLGSSCACSRTAPAAAAAGEQRQENERDASPRPRSPVAARPFDPAERERRAHRGRDDHDPNLAGCTEDERPGHHAGDSGEKERGPARVCEDHGDQRPPGCEGCRAGGRPIGRACPDVRELRPAEHEGSDDANRHPRHAARGKERRDATPHPRHPEARTSPSPTS